MKDLNKQERIQKEAQIKSLIRSALEYVYPEDLLDMLNDVCDSDQAADLEVKCAEILLINGGKYIAEVDLVTEAQLKKFCKDYDIKLKGRLDV